MGIADCINLVYIACRRASAISYSGSTKPFAVRLRGGFEVGDAVFRSMGSYPCSAAWSQSDDSTI